MAEQGLRAVFLLSVCFAIIHVSSSYRGGAPKERCGDMTPGHYPGPSNDLPPYRITVSQTSFTASSKIIVTINATCGTPFVGFFLQARLAEDVNSDLVGTFNTPSNSLAVQCSTGAAVTHKNNTAKNIMQFEWTAPSTGLPNHIVFVATIVQSYSKYWVKLYSEVVTQTTVNTPPTIPAGVTYPSGYECPQAPVPPTDPSTNGTDPSTNGTDPSTTDPPEQPGSVTTDTECGSTKGCFSDCGNNGQCNFIVAWTPSTDSIKLELKAKVDGSDARWIAVGFSKDDRMGDDSVLECGVAGSLMEASRSKNTGRSNQRLGAENAISISLNNAVLSCSMDIPKTNAIFDPTQKYTLLFATGNTVSGSSTVKMKHSKAPVASPPETDLLKTSELVATAPSNVLVKAHGSLMITAWVFMASFGLVVARYYKQLGGVRKWCGLHIWFQLHRMFMVLTFLLASIAFIIIFVDVKGYSQVGMAENELQFLRAHPILGIISTALVVLNPLMALARPHPGTANRPIFNWLHWGVGTTAWIVSMIAIFFGFEIEKSGVHPYTKYIMAAFVAYQLLIELILEFHGCMTKSEQRPDSYEMTNTNGKTSEVARHSIMKTGSTGAGVFRTVVLVAHFFILLGFLIALLALVNLERLRNTVDSIL